MMNHRDTPSSFEPVSVGHGDADERIGAQRIELGDLAGGCLLTIGSAVVTCCLLVMNGALVMAVLATVTAGGVNWFNEHPSASQFTLFAAPILLTVIQWMMIDTLRRILRRSSK